MMYESRNSALLLVVTASVDEFGEFESKKLNTRNSRRIHIRARDCISGEAAIICGVRSRYPDSGLLPTCSE
jgi:hypothetical protein